MKNNILPVSDQVCSPLIWKLILIGGGVLVMIMLVSATRSIIRVLRSPSSPAAAQTNMKTVAVNPSLPPGTSSSSVGDNFKAQTPPLSTPDNSKPAASLPSQLPPVDVQMEIMRQREKARMETIAALKREALEQAGTSGVPKEVLQKLEQSDPIIY